jgi:hypothetical protein
VGSESNHRDFRRIEFVGIGDRVDPSDTVRPAHFLYASNVGHLSERDDRQQNALRAVYRCRASRR